jgi:hypothetical protein
MGDTDGHLERLSAMVAVDALGESWA